MYEISTSWSGLLAQDASAWVVGMVHEEGPEQIRNGSLLHTVMEEDGEPRAEVIVHGALALVVLWYTKPGPDGELREAVEDVLLLRDMADAPGSLAQLDYYYFCPELLAEVVGELGLPVQTNGYRYPLAPDEAGS